MKLRYKVGGSLLLVIAVAVGVLMLAMSRDEPCEPAAALPAGKESMKAVVSRCYGSPDALQYTEVEKPSPGPGDVLVKVHAAAANPYDVHFMRGKPYVMRLMSGFGRPKDERAGVDFAGTVEAVGAGVTGFSPGDAVYGGRSGAFAEYLVMPANRAIVKKPANVTFEQAASVGIAAITALQALRDKGKLEAGQHVLINGASGGVGTFAVQMAKAMGAEVTGVCSTRNEELVRSIGADHVIDYTREDYTEGEARYDVIVDNVGNQPLLANRRVLKPGGILVMVSAPKEGQWIGPLIRPARARLLDPFVDEVFAGLLAEFNKEDLELIGEMIADGRVQPVIDRRYSLAEVPEALRYSETGRARGKIIVNVANGGGTGM